MSVDAVIVHLAEEPQQLDSFADWIRQDQDDPEWSEARRSRMHEARRRTLERIELARQQAQ